METSNWNKYIYFGIDSIFKKQLCLKENLVLHLVSRCYFIVLIGAFFYYPTNTSPLASPLALMY